MADVFLSYKREDQQIAREVATDLETEGFSVFFDVRIDVGDSWDATIERELNAAKAVVVLWSPKSRESKWVRREAREAMERGILCPAIIARCKVPLEFNDVQAADLIGRRARDHAHAEWRRLCDGVGKCVGRKARGVDDSSSTPSGGSAEPESKPSVRLPKLRRPALVVAAVLAVLVVILLSLRLSAPTQTAEGEAGITDTSADVVEASAEPALTQQLQLTVREELGALLGTWRCSVEFNHPGRLIRFTALGDDIIVWTSTSSDEWHEMATSYVHPRGQREWTTGYGRTVWALREGQIELVSVGSENGSYPLCPRYERD